LDGFDLAAIVGYLLLIVGIGLWSVPAALSVAGALLLAFGVAGSRAKAGGE
jgi:hypothetical protein